MSEQFLVSVIVPIYKVEAYIDKCIRSILKQTYKNYEVLLVDDGSPDKCPDICDKYACEYDNIRVLHKKNGGLSDARNAGVSIARGEYVTFVDSDDYIADDYIETLVSMKKKYDVEIAVGGIGLFYSNQEPYYNKAVKEYKYSGIEALENMLYQNGLDTSACSMLLPKKIAENILFPVGKYHEDEFTTYKYYTEADSVAVSTKTIYYYLQRENSIMHTFGKTSMDELDAADNLVEECKKNWPFIIKAAKAKKFSDYCQVLLQNVNIVKQNPEVYTRISHYLNEVKIEILFNSRCRFKNRVAACALIGGCKTLIGVNCLQKKITKIKAGL